MNLFHTFPLWLLMVQWHPRLVHVNARGFVQQVIRYQSFFQQREILFHIILGYSVGPNQRERVTCTQRNLWVSVTKSSPPTFTIKLIDIVALFLYSSLHIPSVLTAAMAFFMDSSLQLLNFLGRLDGESFPFLFFQTLVAA